MMKPPPTKVERGLCHHYGYAFNVLRLERQNEDCAPVADIENARARRGKELQRLLTSEVNAVIANLHLGQGERRDAYLRLARQAVQKRTDPRITAERHFRRDDDRSIKDLIAVVQEVRFVMFSRERAAQREGDQVIFLVDLHPQNQLHTTPVFDVGMFQSRFRVGCFDDCKHASSKE